MNAAFDTRRKTVPMTKTTGDAVDAVTSDVWDPPTLAIPGTDAGFTGSASFEHSVESGYGYANEGQHS